MEMGFAGEAERRMLLVHQKTWEADGVTSVTFVDPTHKPLPVWRPGAHLAVHLPDGLVREYSLCSDPRDTRHWTVAVLRTADSRGGSQYIHESLPVGAQIEVVGPRENFHLEPAPSHLLMAGGIGITPIIAMARELERLGEEWSILYTGRHRAAMAFLEDLDALPRERVHIHVDDEAGHFPDLVTAMGSLDPRTVVYACGPEPFMAAIEQAMPHPEQLRIERFKAPERIVPEDETDDAFDVILASSGERIPVDPEETVLEALETAGLDVPSSCTEGICGTCETAVVAGEVDHRDFLMTAEEHDEAGTMMICVSRCRGSELTLEL